VFDQRTTPELGGEQCAPLVVDKLGALWIGTMGGGLARYAKGRFEGGGRREGSTFEYPLTILPVLGGGVWIGTNDRLHHFESGRFRVFGPEDGVSLSRPQPTHEALGGIWLQGDSGRTGVLRDGIFKEDPGIGVLYPRIADRPVRAYRGLDHTGWYSQYDPVSMTRWGLGGTQSYDLHVADPRDGVTQIVPVARDAAWVGLRQGGLRLLDGDRMTTIGRTEGLPDGPVAAMVRDREGNLWVGTSGGLTRVSPKSVLDPGALRVNDVAPQVIVESVLYDRVHPGGAASATLPAGSKTLELHYTATSAVGARAHAVPVSPRAARDRMGRGRAAPRRVLHVAAAGALPVPRDRGQRVGCLERQRRGSTICA
jgi:ligand-binding sensor domain-containing protein